MRYLLLIFCWLCSASWALAQQTPPGKASGVKGQIQGMVADSATGAVLREASVSLLAGKDSSYLSFTITDGDGRFTLRNAAPGRYLLMLSFLGYKNQLVPVNVTAASPTVNVGTLSLRATAHTLSEVVVAQERAPVSMQGDTLAFSAKAFKTQPNAAVESLLKKLPGVEVDRDGNIRAHGQNVQRVLVDGKPFFGDDPKMATRNLPADIIDQVQLYNQRSDQSAFSGIDDGQQSKTLNLVTKRDKRKGYFGQNGAGAGTDGRYQARLGLNRFNNGRQLSAVGQANNLNQLGFGDDGGPAAGDARGGPGSLNTDLPGGFGGQAEGSPVLVSGGGRQGRSGSSAGGGNQLTGLTELVAGGVNYRDAWGKRAEVATSYFASRATLSNDQEVRRENLTAGTQEPDASLLTEQQNHSRSTTLNHRFNFRLDYKLDSLTSLRLTPTMWWRRNEAWQQTQQQTSTGSSLLNQSLGRYDALSSALWGGGNALLMHKFKREGRTLSANLNTVLNNQEGEAFNEAANTFFAPDGSAQTSAINQRLDQDQPARTHALNLSFTEPLSLRHKLELRYNLANTYSSATRAVYDFEEATDAYTKFNSLLSNEFASGFTTNRAGLTLQTSRLRYTYSLGLDGQQARLQANNQTADTSFLRRYYHLLPSAMFSYNGSQSRQLRLNYRTRLQPPTAPQLQPVPDNTNPLSVRLGNPGLQPEFVHTLSATFTQFNAVNNRSVFAMLSGNTVRNRIVSSTSFSPTGVQTTQPVNANGYATANGYLSLGQRLAWHKLNVNLSTSGNLTRSTSFVEGQPNAARSWSLGQGLSLNSAFNDYLEFGLNGNATYQRAFYSLLPQQNTAYLTTTLSADVYYQLPGRWVLTSDIWLTSYRGRAAGFNQTVVLWNASLARQFFANKQGELKLQAYDLLRQNRSLVRNLTDTYLEDVRSRMLTQYFLLSFTYNLRHFGK